MRTRTYLTIATAAVSLGGLAVLGGGSVAGAAVGVSISNASFTDKFTNNEITIAANPRDTKNLVIGDNDYAANDGCGVNTSFDGGKTWGTHSFIPHITTLDDNNNTTDGHFDFAGDPAVAFGSNGTAYFACYGYGIHGTNVQSSVGKAVSHGCFRMRKQDVEELYTLVQVGDTVTVRRERDAMIAQVFATPVAPAAAKTLVAQNGGGEMQIASSEKATVETTEQ